VWGKALPLVEADLQACRRLIASSRFTRDRVLERAGPWPPIEVVHPMADLVEARQAPEPMPEGLRLLTVARMATGERYKGHRLVLSALAWLQARNQLSDQLSWRVVGEGNDRAALEARTRELGLEPWVEFLGALPDAALERELRHCSVLLMPSGYGFDEAGEAQGEGFGIVYLEAAQAGRAAIASRLGGQSDLILDGQTGWLIDPEPTELAALLLQLEREPTRLDLAGQRARQRAVEQFSAACFDRSLSAAINGGPAGEA
jgi:glycosyltransferase involved in cell wall biosynthesis